MNILYTCDNNYIWLMGISMISIFENNKAIHDLEVYLIGENISDSNIRNLQNIAARYERKFIYISLPNLNIPERLCSKRWPKSAYTRMFAANILPTNVKKIVYLDCDVIVSGDISAIENYLKPDTYFCGVKDCISKHYKTNIGLKPGDPYINAGVMIINVEALRKIDINKRINDFLNQYGNIINYADQDLLNGCFNGKVSILPLEYDVMTSVACWSFNQLKAMRLPDSFYTIEEYNYAKMNPKIIHYTTNMLVVRPWYVNSDHPHKDVFLQYMALSPWNDKNCGMMVFKGFKNFILKACLIFPLPLACPVLGIIHSLMLPKIKYVLSRRKRV